MLLDQIQRGLKPPVPSPLIGADKALARELQQRLADLGLLDPPVDGAFGPVSRWALVALAERLQLQDKPALDAELAGALLAAGDDTFPLRPPGDGSLIDRIVQAMRARGHWICRLPEAMNIVYIEGMAPDGRLNGNEPDRFNDTRLVFRVAPDGRPEVLGAWDATTEPGKHYTETARIHPRGAARIAFGQHKAWSLGRHPMSAPDGHEALVQTAELTVHRDFNADYSRSGDATDTGLFGVNQHWGYDNPPNAIGRASAGCLVGRTKSGHREFMALCKKDARLRFSAGYRFMSTVLRSSDL